MYQRIKPLLFRLEPERAHNLTVNLLRASAALPPVAALLRSQFRPDQPPAAVRAFGLNFPNPLGLAAGYDKDGLAWRGLAALGFGHIEVGTVTVRPQGGNPGPRVFRIPESEAVINRMGFPNRGAEFVARRLQGPRPAGLVLGVNIGKNKDTPLEEAAQDYTSLIRTFAPLADYLTVNISSPNTPGLRALQSGPALDALLAELRVARLDVSRKLGRNVPILLKLAPDLTPGQLVEAVGAIRQAGMDGIILSNTTLRRDGLTSPLAGEIGGHERAAARGAGHPTAARGRRPHRRPLPDHRRGRGHVARRCAGKAGRRRHARPVVYGSDLPRPRPREGNSGTPGVPPGQRAGAGRRAAGHPAGVARLGAQPRLRFQARKWRYNPRRPGGHPSPPGGFRGELMYPLPVALQLYSIRENLAQGFDAAVRKVAAMGYSGVETAMFPGTTPAAAGNLFRELGLTVSSAHSALPLGDKKNEVLDNMAALGCSRIVLAWLRPSSSRIWARCIRRPRCSTQRPRWRASTG